MRVPNEPDDVRELPRRRLRLRTEACDRHLPQSVALGEVAERGVAGDDVPASAVGEARAVRDRKSTRLNSSHGYISYAVFCLKKKKKKQRDERQKMSSIRA